MFVVEPAVVAVNFRGTSWYDVSVPGRSLTDQAMKTKHWRAKFYPGNCYVTLFGPGFMMDLIVETRVLPGGNFSITVLRSTSATEMHIVHSYNISRNEAHWHYHDNTWRSLSCQ